MRFAVTIDMVLQISGFYDNIFFFNNLRKWQLPFKNNCLCKTELMKKGRDIWKLEGNIPSMILKKTFISVAGCFHS